MVRKVSARDLSGRQIITVLRSWVRPAPRYAKSILIAREMEYLCAPSLCYDSKILTLS